MKLGIIGAGAWGSALSISSANCGNSIVLWSYDQKNTDEINTKHSITALPDVIFPKNIVATSTAEDLINTEAWLIVVPAAFFRETIKTFKEIWNEQPIIICTKGMEPNTYKFMSEILNEEIPSAIGHFGVLSGPQFAREVALGVPTGSTIAGPEIVKKTGKIALSNLYLEESDDIIGTEICGVGKNAVAILAGFYSKKAGGENEKALKLTLAWGEIVKFGLQMGADAKTFLSLAGLGDLFLSATSATSRNFSAGITIANTEKIDNKVTVEGITAIRGVLKRSETVKIKMPTLEYVASFIN